MKAITNLTNTDTAENAGERQMHEFVVDPEEKALAKQEAKVSDDTYTHTFAKPFEWMGESYDELRFDFKSLIGADSEAVERDMERKGLAVMIEEYSFAYLMGMAACACTDKLGTDAFLAMKVKDQIKIKRKMRSFLLKSEQAEEADA